jgi:hypothetical protein
MEGVAAEFIHPWKNIIVGFLTLRKPGIFDTFLAVKMT